MAENDDGPKAAFTDEGKLVVAITKSLFAGDVDTAFREIKAHMLANNLKVTAEVLNEFNYADLISRD